MKYIKQLNIIIICLFLAFSPLVALGSFSYAENTPPVGGGGGGEWDPINSEEELVASFKAYCRSRNFDISHEPNTVKAIVKYDYEQIQKIATILNVDLTSLNAHIWYCYDNNGLLKFFFDNTALSVLSGIYAEIINENNISDNSQKNLYSGEYFQDSDSNSEGCFVFYVSGNGSGNYQPSKIGTFYRYVGSQLFAMNPPPSSLTFNIHNQNYSLSVQKTDTTNFQKLTFNNNSSAFIYRNEKTNWGGYNNKFGHLGIFKVTSSPVKYYIGTYWVGTEYYNVQGTSSTSYNWCTVTQINSPDVTPANIQANQGETTNPPTNKNLIINTQDTTINNYITNNNTTNNTYDYTDDNPLEPPNYTNPYNDNPTGTTIGPDGGINFQMPDLNLNWNLNFDVNNLPFPFSIPFDIVSFLNALDQEAVTPEFEIPFTIAGQEYEVDISLHDFDSYMPMIRNLIALGYAISLIVATRGIFKVY